MIFEPPRRMKPRQTRSRRVDSRARGLRAASWLPVALALGWPVPGNGQAADSLEGASPAVVEPQGSPLELPEEASALRKRFHLRLEGKTLLLRPIESERFRALREAVIQPDGSVEVNGKPFDPEELRSFLGEDGELLSVVASWPLEMRLALVGVEDHGTGTHDRRLDRSPRKRRAGHPSGGLEDRLSFGRPIRIESGERVQDVLCFGCSVKVDGTVFGECVAFGGSVELGPGARVRKDVVAFGGSVDLAEESRIGGDAVAYGGNVKVASGASIGRSAVVLGGTVRVEEGGRIEQERKILAIGSKRSAEDSSGWSLLEVVRPRLQGVRDSVLRALALMALAVGIGLLLGEKRLEPLRVEMRERPWRTFWLGLLVLVITGPGVAAVALGLLVSIVGIPFLVLIPVVPIAALALAAWGFAAAASGIGRYLLGEPGPDRSRQILAICTGVLVLQASGILGRLVGLPGAGFQWVGWFLVGVGFAVKLVVWTIGLGASAAHLLAGKRRGQPLPSGPPDPSPGTSRETGVPA